MATVPGTQLTIDDETPERIDIDETDYRPGSNVGDKTYGRVCSYYVDGWHHFGGDEDVTNTGADRGARFPAGFYSYDLNGDSEIWLIAPDGESITVERASVNV